MDRAAQRLRANLHPKEISLRQEAYTAGVLMHEMREDVEPAFVVEDVVHGQWSALTREKRIRQAAEFDQARYGYGRVTYWVEQEPGSGGKESAERTVRETLRGFAAFADKVTGDKVTCLTQAGHCASTCGRLPLAASVS